VKGETLHVLNKPRAGRFHCIIVHNEALGDVPDLRFPGSDTASICGAIGTSSGDDRGVQEPLLEQVPRDNGVRRLMPTRRISRTSVHPGNSQGSAIIAHPPNHPLASLHANKRLLFELAERLVAPERADDGGLVRRHCDQTEFEQAPLRRFESQVVAESDPISLGIEQVSSVIINGSKN